MRGRNPRKPTRAKVRCAPWALPPSSAPRPSLRVRLLELLTLSLSLHVSTRASPRARLLLLPLAHLPVRVGAARRPFFFRRKKKMHSFQQFSPAHQLRTPTPSGGTRRPSQGEGETMAGPPPSAWRAQVGAEHVAEQRTPGFADRPSNGAGEYLQSTFQAPLPPTSPSLA